MMEKKCIISTIIPVYNVEKYIDECLFSIVNQTIGIENIEIIIVNDCTKDKSMEIVQKYKNKYPNSFVIIENKKNIGLGASRNIALERAQGDFVTFVDSDDFLDKNVFEYAILQFKKNNVDLFLYQFLYFREGTNMTFTKEITRENYQKEDNIVCNDDFVKYPNLVHEVSACNKIYKTKNIQGKYIFRESRKFEDVCFSVQTLFDSKCIYITNKVRYNYRKRAENDSITDSSFGDIEYFNDQIDELLKAKDLIKDYPEKKIMIDWLLVYSWSIFLHHLLLDDLTNITIKQKESIFIKTKFLWQDVVIDEKRYEKYAQIHHKKLLNMVKKSKNFVQLKKDYRKRILFYKLHSKITSFLK